MTEKRKGTTPTGISSTATDGSIAIIGEGNTAIINETSLILRFLSLIEEQNRTIARLQEELLRLSGLRLTEIENKQNKNRLEYGEYNSNSEPQRRGR